MNLNEIAEEGYKTAIKRGQWNKENNIEKALIHLHTEVSELANATKNANYGIFEQLMDNGMSYKEAYEFAIKNTIEDEISDILIINTGLAKHMEIDIEKAVIMKMKYNSERND